MKTLTLFSSLIIQDTVENIRTFPHWQFSMMMDGKEQEEARLRYVDKDLVPHEESIGLYEASLTDSLDVLLWIKLPITGLCGQAYDGAATQTGKYN